MRYLYVLKDEKTNNIYYGYTDRLEQSIAKHKAKMKSLKLVYYEGYEEGPDAENTFKKYAQMLKALKARPVN